MKYEKESYDSSGTLKIPDFVSSPFTFFELGFIAVARSAAVNLDVLMVMLLSSLLSPSSLLWLVVSVAAAAASAIGLCSDVIT